MKLKCKFIAGASSFSSLPDEAGYEIALIGRSNVGKSSLINSIVGAENTARVSSNPGCTRQINFFSINDDNFRLVDLPGYGYSKAGKMVSYKYLELVELYLLRRRVLKKVMLLIDSRRGVGDIDLDFINWMESSCINYQIVLTKIDKLNSQELSNISDNFQSSLPRLKFLIYPLFFVSNKTKSGLGELINEIIRS